MPVNHKCRGAAIFVGAAFLLTLFSGCAPLQSLYKTIQNHIGDAPEDEQTLADAPQPDEPSADNSIIPAEPIIDEPEPENQPLVESDPPIEEIPPAEKDPPIETDPPAPEQEPKPYGKLEAGERVADSYFDDAVFVGDSVSLMLQYYTIAMRAQTPDYLGTAQFLTAGSFSYRNALAPLSDTSLHPSYNGEKMLLEDAIAAMGAKKVYIMLGMNDIGNRNYTKTLENIDLLVARIREKSADVVFYFQSVTPRMENSETETLNNDIIARFNEKLVEYCVENEHYYLHVYEAVCDESGNLLAEFCGDPVSEGGVGMGIHFTYSGCAAWVEYLYTHTS